MKIISLIFITALSLSGCTLIYSYSDNLPQDISQWIKQKKYNLALNTINHIKPTHKDYAKIQQQKKIILNQVISYEQQVIEETTLLADKGDWIIALEKLDEAAENIPNATKIEQHRNKLIKRRDKLIAEYEYQLLTAQAEDLSGKIDFYDKIRKTIPENGHNILSVSKFDALRNEVSINLFERSEYEYKNSNYGTALEAINLALILKPDEKTSEQIQKLKDTIREDGKLRTKYYSFSAKSLINKLAQGYSHEILKETRETINQLKMNQGNETFHDELIAQLEKHFDNGVLQYFEAGRVLYSKGKTQEALSIWLEMRDLAPDHPKLKSHISRAEKVLKKLKKLSEKPKSN